MATQIERSSGGEESSSAARRTGCGVIFFAVFLLFGLGVLSLFVYHVH